MTKLTDGQRAGYALQVLRPKLAEATVAEQYRLGPDLVDRYGPEGRRYCVRDVGHHVDALAASLELGDTWRFVGYVRWARGVMRAHGIAPPICSPAFRPCGRSSRRLCRPGRRTPPSLTSTRHWPRGPMRRRRMYGVRGNMPAR